MPFGLKNAPSIFSKIVVTTFKEFIHKFFEVYLDEWKIFSFLKGHMNTLHLMLYQCLHIHISLNFKKCIFFTPFGTLLGYVVSKDGLLFIQDNILSILDMVPPTSIRDLYATLGYTIYYHQFIQNDVKIASPFENLLHKDTKYVYTQDF
jgi:hypothetical protein